MFGRVRIDHVIGVALRPVQSAERHQHSAGEEADEEHDDGGGHRVAAYPIAWDDERGPA